MSCSFHDSRPLITSCTSLDSLHPHPHPCTETHCHSAAADQNSIFPQLVALRLRAKRLHFKSPYNRFFSEQVQGEPGHSAFRSYFWFAAKRQLNERLGSFFKLPRQTLGLFLPCCLYRHFINIYHYSPQGALRSVIFEIIKPLRWPFKRFTVKLHH